MKNNYYNDNNGGTSFTPQRVQQLNKEQEELRENLPSFLDMVREVKEGNIDNFDLFFMNVLKIEKWNVYGSKKKVIHTYMKFMDAKINYFLIQLKSKYSDVNGIVLSDKTVGGKHSVMKSSTMKFEREEIDVLFYEYLKSFINKCDLDKFQGKTEEHTYNKVVKYIKTDFEKNVLQKEYNKRMGIERVQINNEMYTVKNQQETVLFDDIGATRDKNGQVEFDGDEPLTFAEIISSDGMSNSYEYSRDETSDFIVNNYKTIMTNNQLDKFNQIVEWCEQEGNSVEDLFQRNNPNKISKTEVSKILYPNRDIKGTMRNIDDLFSSMNKRLDKKLKENGIERKEVSITSSYNRLKSVNGERKNEEKQFKKLQLHKYVIGAESNFTSNHDYVKENHFYGTKPFISKEDYGKLIEGELSVDDIIQKYNIDVNDLTGKNSKVTTYKVSNEGEQEDLVIDEKELDAFINSALESMIRAIWDKKIKYIYDSENNVYVFNTRNLKPIPKEEIQSVLGYSLTKGVEVLKKYHNYNTKELRLTIKGRDYKEEDNRVKYVNPIQLQTIRKEKEGK